MLTEISRTLDELERLHQLNFELLEQLNVVCGYLMTCHISVRDKERLASLLTKAMILLAEIQSETPKTLLYRKITDENLQRKRTDEDFTEPDRWMVSDGLCFQHVFERFSSQ